MIDLRSDTVTLPTEEMREAMARAELGDDSRDRDPTVRRLEEAAAAATGKEAAVFVPSGTMSNLVALRVPAADIARHCDSVGFCVSKALSAPFGSVLCGSASFIERARAFRRMCGGAMRQAGIMAAAGLVALERMVARLADDHTRGK